MTSFHDWDGDKGPGRKEEKGKNKKCLKIKENDKEQKKRIKKEKTKEKKKKKEQEKKDCTNDESWSGLNSSCSRGYCDKQTDVEVSPCCCVIIALIISSQAFTEHLSR